jgi:vacuolar-type H+-ATPase subunit F/Vma7
MVPDTIEITICKKPIMLFQIGNIKDTKKKDDLRGSFTYVYKDDIIFVEEAANQTKQKISSFHSINAFIGIVLRVPRKANKYHKLTEEVKKEINSGIIHGFYVINYRNGDRFWVSKLDWMELTK